MSTKYNTKHFRSKSNYPSRPGIYSHERMEDLETLRARQNARIRNTCTIKHNHNSSEKCNGRPFI